MVTRRTSSSSMATRPLNSTDTPLPSSMTNARRTGKAGSRPTSVETSRLTNGVTSHPTSEAINPRTSARSRVAARPPSRESRIALPLLLAKRRPPPVATRRAPSPVDVHRQCRRSIRCRLAPLRLRVSLTPSRKVDVRPRVRHPRLHTPRRHPRRPSLRPLHLLQSLQLPLQLQPMPA